MESRAGGLLEELRNLIRQLGRDGGQMSPAVYDTAQVLRLYPPKEGVEPGLRWLLAQQAADGGWGNPHMPRTRDVPTLAAVLALHTHCQIVPAKSAVEAGLEYLRQHANLWAAPLPDDIPIAVELILPDLVRKARQMGLNLESTPYQALVQLGDKKRQLIARMPVRAGTPFVYSFEAWGTEPTEALLDRFGSVGSSPSATAAWLALAVNRPTLAAATARAEGYLARASSATGSHIPGLSPTVWPINRYEQAFTLYALLTAGLLDYPELTNSVIPQMADLNRAIRPHGLGFNDFFTVDGDDTAAAVAVLNATGFRQDPGILLRYQSDSYFFTYERELQPSITVTARAVGALTSYGLNVRPWQNFLAQTQTAAGNWRSDKWHASWLYTTCVVLNALRGSHHDAQRLAFDALHRGLHREGGWGIGGRATLVETAFGLLAMTMLRDGGIQDPRMDHDIARAYHWLLGQYQNRPFESNELWLGKQLYCPGRIDQGFILGALVKVALSDSLSETSKSQAHANGISLPYPNTQQQPIAF